jgi:putative metal-binding protein
MRWSLCGTVLLLVNCTGCSGEPRIVAVLHWGGFRPGCVELVATPVGGAPFRPVQIPTASADRAGDRSVAVYVPEGQGPQVDLEALAREESCEGAVVSRAVDQAVAAPGGRVVTLALSASDPDDDGFISTLAALPGTDCAEGDAYVHPKPGGETLCDGVDDDCRSGPDDTFGVGQPCAGQGCPGTLACDAQGAVRCSAAVADWWADQDGDDWGTQFLGTFCGPDAGLAGAPGDCDDSDPYIHPGALEVCNGKDDDCNGAADDTGGACTRVSIPPSANLLTVHARVRGRAWAAGIDGGLFALSSDGGAAVKTGLCGIQDWRALWVDGQDRAYLGAPWARVAHASDAGQGACATATVGTTTQVNGAWGYPAVDGGTQVYFVTSNGNVEHWAPPSAPSQLFQVGTGSDNLRALDGVAPYPRLTAGWFYDGVLHPRVWVDKGSGFVDQGVDGLAGTGVALYGVSMPRADLGYACGEQSTVLAFDGGTWVKLPRPSAEAVSLNSIKAFDEGHVYVAGFGSQASWVWRWDGAKWKPVMRLDYDAGSIRALGGTAPDDIWAVGRGNAWHLSPPP